MQNKKKHPDIKEILLLEKVIRKKVSELAAVINRDYRGKKPILVSILKGSVVFLCDLIRQLEIPVVLDFMSVSSYAGDSESSGVVRLLMDMRESIVGRDVLIIEDIIDTGLTLSYLKRNLMTRKPSSLKICVLLDKKACRKIEIKVDYAGFVIPNKFCVGYGLDYNQFYRELPYIGVLKPEIYRTAHRKI
ncbi:MAG: hypoxanthine phosphoribosyltransferase [Elusimicrobia bacterium CG08_land_8_20_14_0_20_44_26]|nr:MAG: hypoxanthine phosphoribosyltransferase [Elusimicrobia bacterium CG08_land_8_20_14_0_20_44_26]